jgi:hypothetical protein
MEEVEKAGGSKVYYALPELAPDPPNKKTQSPIRIVTWQVEAKK